MELEKIKDRFNLVAQQYDNQRRFFIPCFDDFYQTSISLLSKIKPRFTSILDLGAGTGLLSRFLFEKYPDARYTLADVSDQMLEVARLRFTGMNNFSFESVDYSAQLPQGSFDLIASALSIHHLENDSKAALYSNIYHALPEDGCFLNLDQFNPSSEIMNRYYIQWWYGFIEQSEELKKDKALWLKRRELDRENTVSETIALLRQAGFRQVECIYSFMKFGVVLALK